MEKMLSGRTGSSLRVRCSSFPAGEKACTASTHKELGDDQGCWTHSTGDGGVRETFRPPLTFSLVLSQCTGGCTRQHCSVSGHLFPQNKRPSIPVCHAPSLCPSEPSTQQPLFFSFVSSSVHSFVHLVTHSSLQSINKHLLDLCYIFGREWLKKQESSLTLPSQRMTR